MSFINDYNFGKEQEIKILDRVEDYFKDNIKIVKTKNSRFDYIGDKNIYELKSRKFNYNKYPTTLITCSKVILGKEDNLYFIFNFTDDIYYIKYNNQEFEKFEKKSFRRYRKDFNDKEENYFYIPIEKLTKI